MICREAVFSARAIDVHSGDERYGAVPRLEFVIPALEIFPFFVSP